jgi:hypothetical protein
MSNFSPAVTGLRSVLFCDIKQRLMVILDPWRWNRYVLPKRRYRIATRCCVIFEQSVDLINIAAEAWNDSDRVHNLCVRSVLTNGANSSDYGARNDGVTVYKNLEMAYRKRPQPNLTHLHGRTEKKHRPPVRILDTLHVIRTGRRPNTSQRHKPKFSVTVFQSYTRTL